MMAVIRRAGAAALVALGAAGAGWTAPATERRAEGEPERFTPGLASTSRSGGSTAVPLIAATVVGEPLALSVRDDDLVAEPSVTVVVERRDGATGVPIETETVVLPRVGPAGGPGGFALPATDPAALATLYGGGPTGSATDGVIHARAGDVFVVRVADRRRADGSPGPAEASATIGGGATGLARLGDTLDHAPGGTDQTPVGAAIPLLIDDADLTGLAVDATVERRDGAGALVETQAVRLTRRTPLGPFSGSLPTVFGALADGDGTLANGSINAVAGDRMILRYADGLTADGSPAELLDPGVMGGGATGTIRIAVETPGRPIAVSVSDADLAPGGRDFTVSLRNGPSGAPRETEAVSVSWDATADGGAGAYVGLLPTTFGVAADPAPNRMAVRGGDTVTATYVDAFVASGGSGTAEDAALVGSGTTGDVTIAVGRAGRPAPIALADADLPAVLGATVDVRVENLATGQVETVTLLFRTASGRYEGALSTAFRGGAIPSAAGATGTMGVRATDTLLVTYGDALTAAGGPGTVSASGTVPAGTDGTVSILAGRPGTDVALLVADADLASPPGETLATVSVQVENVATGEVEPVTLRETAAGSGLFSGSLPTDYGTGTPGDGGSGRLFALAPQTLRASYADAYTAAGGAGHATDTDRVRGGATGAVAVAVGDPGSELTVLLADADLSGTGPIPLDVNASGGAGETETALLFETGPGTGTFVGTIPTRLDAIGPEGGGSGVSADGVLDLRGPSGDDRGYLVTVAYGDLMTGDGGTRTATDSGMAGGADTGLVALSAGRPGEDAVVVLADMDLAGTPLLPGRVAVLVARSTGGATGDRAASATGGPTVEYENLVLAELDPLGAPGVLTGRLPTRYGVGTGLDYDAEMTVRAGDALAVTYNDALTDGGGSGTATADDTVTGGATGLLSIAAGLPGGEVTLRLADDDLAGAGTIRLAVANTGAPGERPRTVLATLAETDPIGEPGTFTAVLPTGFRGIADPGVAGGQLLVRRNDVLRVAYTDGMAGDGEPSVARAATALVGGGDTGLVVIAATVPGAPVAVTLVDDDLAGLGPATVRITNTSSPAGLSRTVPATLVEADPLGQPGVFSAAVPTGFRPAGTAGAAGDRIRVRRGDELRVDYADARMDAGEMGSDFDVSPVGGGTTATVAIDAGPVGRPAALEVIDPDRAADALVTVAVANTLTGETESVVLRAVPGAGGTFRGTVDTAFGTLSGPGPADGVVNVSADDPAVPGAHRLQIRYTDPLGADGGPVDLAADDPVAGGATGVPVVAATGVGRPLDLLVTDADLAGRLELSVAVRNGATGESESVRLRVDPLDPTRFSGTLPTAFPRGAARDDDGTLLATAGDTVTIAYPDAFRRDGSAGEETASATIGGGTGGTVAIRSVPVGAAMPITVVDPDLDGRASVTVAVGTTYPDGTAGTETVTLRADPLDPTRFTGEAPTVFGTTDDGDPLNGLLSVAAGVPVTATYGDDATETGGPGTARAAAVPTGGTDALAELDPTEVGGTVPIRLRDPDRVGSAPIPVTVTNVRTGETETVLLPETAGGVFEGTLPTRFHATSPGADDDGTMTARGRDTLVLAATDPFGASGGPTPTGAPRERDAPGGRDAPGAPLVAPPIAPSMAPSVTLGTGVTGTVAVFPAPVGTSTPIVVTDPDAAGAPTVLVTTPGAGPVSVALVETAPGIFSGDLPTLAGTGPAPLDTLRAEPGAPITALYSDPYGAAGGPVTATGSASLPNDPPVAADDSAATGPGEPVAVPVLLNDRDPEGRPLRIAAVSPPDPLTGGTVSHAEDGTLVFTPAPGVGGTVTFPYTVADPGGLVATGTVTVTIDALAPTAVADTAATAPATPVSVPVLRNDDAPVGPLAVIAVAAPVDAGGATVGTATVAGGSIVFDPAPGFSGTASFLYTVRGPAGRTDAATVIVAVEDAPVILAGDDVATSHAEPVAIDLLANDDPGGHGPLAVARATRGANGTVAVDPETGIATFDPEPGFSGTDAFTYEACDARGRCRIADVLVSVEPPPAAVSGTVWRDLDHDGARGASETVLPGWGVEAVRDGAVLAAAATDDAGAYRIDGLEAGAGYGLQLRDPYGVVWRVIEGLTLSPGPAALDRPLPADPSGVVYDAVTRRPLGGATVTVTDASGAPLPEACLLDPSQQGQRTGADGFYRLDVRPGAAAACPRAEAEYRLRVWLDGTGFPSASIPPETAVLDPTGRAGPVGIAARGGAPAGSEPTAYHLRLRLAPGDPDVVNNHIPLDPIPHPTVPGPSVALGPDERTPLPRTRPDAGLDTRPDISPRTPESPPRRAAQGTAAQGMAAQGTAAPSRAARTDVAVAARRAARLDLSIAAFHPGSTTLRPAHRAALEGMMRRLVATPSRLVLVYHEGASESAGEERMRAVGERAETLWRSLGQPYRLDIERTVARGRASAAPAGGEMAARASTARASTARASTARASLARGSAVRGTTAHGSAAAPRGGRLRAPRGGDGWGSGVGYGLDWDAAPAGGSPRGRLARPSAAPASPVVASASRTGRIAPARTEEMARKEGMARTEGVPAPLMRPSSRRALLEPPSHGAASYRVPPARAARAPDPLAPDPLASDPLAPLRGAMRRAN